MILCCSIKDNKTCQPGSGVTQSHVTGSDISISASPEESLSGVVVRSTGAYEKLSGHPSRPVLGWVARLECPVPSHYTCQAAQSGYRAHGSPLSFGRDVKSGPADYV